MASPYISLLMQLACFFPIFSSVHLINGKCLHDQRSYLLQFRDGVQIDQTYSTRVVRWNRSVDCCVWDGVACDGLGHVISLELGDESISSLNDNWKALFHLQYLEDLNLAENHFGGVNIPVELQNLTRLKHLNLSKSEFAGEIPLGLSNMIDLVTLDLSYNGVSIGLKQLFQNLTELREVHLDEVQHISALGSEDCNAFSHLIKLQVLSLFYCGISCPLLPSLSNLTSLTTIRLYQNRLTSTVPHYLANLTSLRILNLAGCELRGPFPEKIFQVRTLEILDVSHNPLLRGRIPQLVRYGSLREISLGSTKDYGTCDFSGSLPDSIGFLRELTHLRLSNCNFYGKVPATLANLSKLEEIDLYNNSLTGRFPSYLFALPSLQRLDLSNNPFDASHLEEFPNASSSSLTYIDLSGNNLIGFIPNFFFHLQRLYFLDISFNSFQGTLRLDQFNNLQKNPFTSLDVSHNDFSSLDLSHNNLSIDATRLSLLPQFVTLKLASCNLKMFPDLKNQSQLQELDLSDNSITGDIPNWLWKLPIYMLNLSVNRLGGFQKPYTLPLPDSMSVIDLHSNELKGEVPLPRIVEYVDYSNNYFTTFNPSDNNDIPTIVAFLSLSNNSITGGIPDFLCNQTSLKVLDLSNNFLNGIFECLLARRQNYGGVLVLSGNKLSGHIPDTFNDSSCGLYVLDLSRNNLTGELPKSLVNCEYIEVVNVGNNNLEGHFPCTLTKLQYLRIVVLRANRFDGELNCLKWDQHSWPSLQVLDISHNHFNGALSSRLFSNCGGMMMDDKSNAPPLDFIFVSGGGEQEYIDSVSLVIKGTELKLVKILSIYKTLDFSCNHFQGSIPKEIGGLRGLYTLNLSHNALTGTIPGSIGHLTQLESIDLSMNQLTGRIPSELGNLTFLSVLNLSYNQLTGRIPYCRQPLSESSFIGNKGLCGFPLSSRDPGSWSPSSPAAGRPDEEEIDWEYVSAALGFSVGLGIILLFNFLNPTWWQRFIALILRFLIIRVFGVHVQ